MRKSNTPNELLKHSFRLRYKTCDLKSKLTALVLYVEECDELDEEKKRDILNLCEAIANKNNELITSESDLINTLDGLFPGLNSGKQISLLNDVA